MVQSASRGGSAPGGGVCSGGVPGRGVSGLGGLVLGSAWFGGDVWSRGSGVLWGGVSQHSLRQTPSPPVDRILDTRL